MALAEAWKAASDLLAHSNATEVSETTRAWRLVTTHLEPWRPSECRFFDTRTASYRLNAEVSAALQVLLEPRKSMTSSSKSDLSTPSSTLVALCDHYVGKCLTSFHSICTEYIPLSELDLAHVLDSASCLFTCWLSPFGSGGIFEGMNQGSELLPAMQLRFRSLVDRGFVQMIQLCLQAFITDADSDVSQELRHMELLGLTSTVLSILTHVLRNEISRKVRAVVEGIDPQPEDEQLPLEEAARPALQTWLEVSIKQRSAIIRNVCTQQSNLEDSAGLVASEEPILEEEFADEATWDTRLDYQLDKTLCQVRASQLFDLIAIYPDSAGALQDLRQSLQTTDQKLMVAKQLDESLRSRLLHPGAHTRDIIQMYVHMVRALRQVDTSGVVLSRVVSPLRKYLRGRKDTVPVIVSSMLGDDPNFTLLKDELEQADLEEHEDNEATNSASKRRRKPRRSLQNRKPAKRAAMRRGNSNAGAQGSESDSSDEDWADPEWVPKPVDAGRNYRLSTSKDIISMLISIFDDRSGFISALEKSMADQLIKVKGYRAMEEYRNNMILKKRFGERNMGKCDVMLGDVTDSRRIDTDVHTRMPGGPQLGMASRLHPLIVSRQFWPEFVTPPAGSEFTLPPIFNVAQEQYSIAYSKSKAMRKLHWLNSLGTVEMDVELDSGQSISVECSLLQASTLEVISRVDQPKIITLTAVMDQLNLQHERDARDALEFWTSVGLLQPLEGLADTFAIQTSLPLEAAEEEL